MNSNCRTNLKTNKTSINQSVVVNKVKNDGNNSEFYDEVAADTTNKNNSLNNKFIKIINNAIDINNYNICIKDNKCYYTYNNSTVTNNNSDNNTTAGIVKDGNNVVKNKNYEVNNSDGVKFIYTTTSLNTTDNNSPNSHKNKVTKRKNKLQPLTVSNEENIMHAEILAENPSIWNSFEESTTNSEISSPSSIHQTEEQLPSSIVKIFAKSRKNNHSTTNKSSSVDRRNARERDRVHTVNKSFKTLRECLPNKNNIFAEQIIGKSNSIKKLSKVEILRMAVQYIKILEEQLQISNDPSNESLTTITDDSVNLLTDSMAPTSSLHPNASDDNLIIVNNIDESNDSQQQYFLPSTSLPKTSFIDGLNYVRIIGPNEYQLISTTITKTNGNTQTIFTKTSPIYNNLSSIQNQQENQQQILIDESTPIIEDLSVNFTQTTSNFSDANLSSIPYQLITSIEKRTSSPSSLPLVPKLISSEVTVDCKHENQTSPNMSPSPIFDHKLMDNQQYVTINDVCSDIQNTNLTSNDLTMNGGTIEVVKQEIKDEIDGTESVNTVTHSWGGWN